MGRPMVIAHRTSPPYAPENSLQGLRVSFEQGADGVEIDLRMSLDWQPYLMHDNTMRRTTGWPLPIELTPSFVVRRRRLTPPPTPSPLAERGLSASSRQAEAPPGLDEALDTPAERGLSAPGGASEPPPGLEEALDALPEGKIIAVDVKTPWSVFPLIGAVRERGIEARTLAWCSSEWVARYLTKRLPGVEVAYYKDYEDGPGNLGFIAKAQRIGVQAVSLDWRGISREVVAAAHAAGLRVYSWHREYELTREKIESGLDGVITDHPAKARAAIEGMG